MFGKSKKEATEADPSIELANVEPTSSHDVEQGDGTEGKGAGTDENDDDYPHGWKLIILASASIIAVFLIALDQVSHPFSPQITFYHH